jgi:hypothetical protein
MRVRSAASAARWEIDKQDAAVRCADAICVKQCTTRVYCESQCKVGFEEMCTCARQDAR